jgi:hypothetical protein
MGPMWALCPFFYQDSHRRATKKECRLIQRNLASKRWDAKLCPSCPVPVILEHNPCANLALEAEVKVRLGLFRKVAVLAVCTAKLQEIDDPKSCGAGCPRFERLP